MNLASLSARLLLASGLLVLATSGLPPLAAADDEMPWAIGGVGGAYLLARPGELEVEVFKRDLNERSLDTDLRAILAGPDREVLDEVVIPHAGGSAADPPGPVQSAVLKAQVERAGIYALNITTKNDRYGLNVAWGMRTNAEAYVVETSRGHRDERHEEPIVLLDGDRPADVCFLPRAGAFEIEVEGLPPDLAPLELADETGAAVAAISVVPERSTRIRDYLRVPAGTEPEGSARFTVPSGEGRGEDPWCLHLARGRAFVSIDGVTRWDAGDRYPDLSVWSPDPASWFRFLEYRWLMTPYQRTAWADPGTQGAMVFRVHNNAPGPRTVALSLECRGAEGPPPASAGQAWLPRVELGLPGRESSDVRADATVARSAGVASIPRPLHPPGGKGRTARADPVTVVGGPASAAEDGPEHLSESRVSLDARQSREVTVSFIAPPIGSERVCHVRATPEQDPQVTTYATLTVRGGSAPAERPLDLPLVLRPYAHENRQLGYLPEYPVDNQPYFDLENRAFVVAARVLFRQVGDGWATTDLSTAVVRRVPEFRATSWSTVSTKIAFDADNDLYLLARSSTTVALLHSTDGGETFTAYVLAGRETDARTWDFEAFTGHNVPTGPPPVVRLTRTEQSTENALRWRSTNDLDLFVGTKDADGEIEPAAPVRLSDRSLGFSLHSGIPSTVVSRGTKVHVVWGEATDPATGTDEIPGVPTYVATYDRATGEAGHPVFLGFGPPPNDGHNTPSVTIDGPGYLHVVVGTHGAPFQYVRSLRPNDAYAGWTEPMGTGDGDLRQTYVGLVAGADDALHLVFRQWRSGEEHLDGATWAALAYQRKLPGQDWEAPRVLVAPPLSEYSIYYHRLTMDREGALYVSYDYWSTMWFYRNDARGGGVAAGSGRPGSGWGRAVLRSGDGGITWSLW